MPARAFNLKPSLPEGFAYRPDLVSPDEERAVVERFATLPFRAFEARTEWEHSIPAVKSLRYSVTFQNLRNG